MEIVLFTLVGIALYLITDRLLVALEKIHGQPLPPRNVVFFVLILMLSLASFSILRSVLGAGQGAQHDNQEQQAPDGGDQSPQTH